MRVSDIYRMLLDVPERVTPETLQYELGKEECKPLFATHRPPEAFALRACLLFGIAECARSSRCISLLRRGEMERVGWLMNVSHDGDRVCNANGQPFMADFSDEALRGLIENVQSENPERVLAAQIYAQAGSYACSLPQIDHMVDLALDMPGVLGAQLAGAGLGGCMMILARKDNEDEIIRRMNEQYYAPNGLEPGAAAFVPIAGCSALSYGLR